jgi:hypothetical protein
MTIGAQEEASGLPGPFFAEPDASSEVQFFEAEPLSLHDDLDNVGSAVPKRPAA